MGDLDFEIFNRWQVLTSEHGDAVETPKEEASSSAGVSPGRGVLLFSAMPSRPTGHIEVFRQHDHYLFDCTLPALWGRLPLPKSLHQPVIVTGDDH